MLLSYLPAWVNSEYRRDKSRNLRSSRSELGVSEGRHTLNKQLNQPIQFWVRSIHMTSHTAPLCHWTANPRQLAAQNTADGTQYCNRPEMIVEINQADVLHCNTVQSGRWSRQTPVHSALLRHSRLQQIYRVIHKSLRNYRTRLGNNQNRHSRVDISSTCKVGQKIGVSLPLLTCSPSARPSRLLCHRGWKSWRDLWITLYSSYVIYLFIYGLFNDATSIASNEWVMKW